MNPASFGRAYVLTRIFTCLLGLGGIAWGGFLFPLFWQQASLDRAASAIIQGDSFKMQRLLYDVQKAATVDRSSVCNPTASRDMVAFRLAILDDAMAMKNKALAAAAYRPLYDATRYALSCNPADSFEWLTLFWLDLTKKGFTSENAEFLRLSYALAPNEGWIAIRRSRLAIALLPKLPADLAGDAISEFVKLVDTGSLYAETAALLANAPPAVQKRLAEALSSAKPVPREIFARTLTDKGLDVDIPGVHKPTRPWD